MKKRIRLNHRQISAFKVILRSGVQIPHARMGVLLSVSINIVVVRVLVVSNIGNGSIAF
jgi:uncharacterized membrane protein